jgi:asparagine synthase (glutamine-hydrolysing)
LRLAFAESLPLEIINRPKQKFSGGAGSAEMMVNRAEETISGAEFATERRRLAQDWNYHLPNKEALYYYRILRQFYQDEWILPGMGCSRSL